ncbi:MAG TPA: hypothetical protein VH157_05100 [Bryobacteraceae bacterium]|jgi:hypothetical protein|nr:hypothetical protein [Bryobacteraceae bacterium]
MDGSLSGVKRFLFWDYPRAGWQYDLMVGLILAFIFLTPRAWFRDQPHASNVVMIRPDAFWVDSDLLSSSPEGERVARVGVLLKARTGKKYNVVRLEPIIDSEQETKGYMAFTAP